MRINTIYKGITRYPTFLGVPLMPLMFTCLPLFFLGFYVNVGFIAILPFVFGFMKWLSMDDDKIFEIWLKRLFAIGDRRINKQKGYRVFFPGDFFRNRRDDDMTLVKNQARSSYLSAHLPYDFISNNVVVTKNYDFIQAWTLEGIASEVQNSDYLDEMRNSLNMFFRQFSDGRTSFYLHNIRKGFKEKLEGKFPSKFSQHLNDSYFKSLEKSTKTNFYVLEVIYSPFTPKALSNFRKADVKEKQEIFNDIFAKCEDTAVKLDVLLQNYEPVRLGEYEENGKIFNSQLEVYNFLVGGKYNRVSNVNESVSSYITGSIEEIKFGEDMGEIRFLDESKRYFQILEIKDYAAQTYSGVFDGLLIADTDYILTQTFLPLNSNKAQSDIELQQKRLNMQGDKAISQIEELTQAMDDLASGEAIFGKYSFAMIVFGDNPVDLRRNVNDIISKVNTQGFLMTKANVAFATTYFSRFSGNFKYRTRSTLVSSLNYSDMISLHNFNGGKRNGNQWGEAVTMLKTRNGQPFFFNFHMEENGDHFKSDEAFLGNTLILGQSGGGKTVLSSFLTSQLLKFGDKDSFAEGTPEDKKKMIVFYLDKDKGAIANVLANGGKYITIDTGKPTGFNPFMCENTENNIQKLENLINMLVSVENEPLTANDTRIIHDRIVSIMSRPLNQRDHGITRLYSMLNENADEANSVKSRLRKWTNQGQYGWVFDNETDNLDFSDNKYPLYGIDGTDMLSDKGISAPAAYYILWRLMDLADGRRFVLLIDEAWDWIKNVLVAEMVRNKLKTIRKQNGFLVLATQSVSDLSKSTIADALIQQSATIILLADPKGKKEDYCGVFNMSEEEYEFVKTTDPALRYFMLRKGADQRTIVTLDLSGIDRTDLALLSTPSAFVDKIQKINESNLPYEEMYKELRAVYAK